MVALDDGAAVDGEDVPLLQDVAARDAVDDHGVGRGADDGREAVVAEEVRGGAPALQHLAGDRVQVGGGDPGLGRGAGLLVHLGHDLAGPAHFGQLVVVSPHGHLPLASLIFCAQRVDGPHHPAGHRVGRAGAVDLDQEAPLLVPVEQGRRLLLVEVEPALDRLFGVVLPLDHLAAADVAGPVDQRRGGRRVVGAAVHAHPARGQALHDQISRHLQVDDQVEAVRLDDLLERLRLHGGARASVEHEAAPRRVPLGEPAPHHLHDHFVGDELALLHERGARWPSGERDFTSLRNMSPVETCGTT